MKFLKPTLTFAFALSVSLLFLKSHYSFAQAAKEQPPSSAGGESTNIILLEPFTKNQKIDITKGPVDIVQQYLKGVYIYGVSLIGSIVLFWIVWGGIDIATSGGDSTKISSGKDRIIKSLISFIILLLSGLILYTINPTFFTK